MKSNRRTKRGQKPLAGYAEQEGGKPKVKDLEKNSSIGNRSLDCARDDKKAVILRRKPKNLDHSNEREIAKYNVPLLWSRSFDYADAPLRMTDVGARDDKT